MICLRVKGKILPSTLCKVFIDIFKTYSSIKSIDCYISLDNAVAPAHKVINYTIKDINHIEKEDLNKNGNE